MSVTTDPIEPVIECFNGSMDRLVRWVAFSLQREIIKTTPVDLGTARARWMIVRTADGYMISNNLPYIEALEFGLYPIRRGPSARRSSARRSRAAGTEDNRAANPTQPRERRERREDEVRITASGFSTQATEGIVRVSIDVIEDEMSRMRTVPLCQ